MKNKKIYNIDNNSFLSTNLNKFAKLKDIVINKNYKKEEKELLETFKSKNTHNLDNNKKKPLDCEEKKLYYSENYNIINLFRDIGFFWLGKLENPKNIENKGCIGSIEEQTIRKKIKLINSINNLIITYIFVILNLVYLFGASRCFGGKESIIPKLLFSLLAAFAGPTYLTWVLVLFFLHKIHY